MVSSVIKELGNLVKSVGEYLPVLSRAEIERIVVKEVPIEMNLGGKTFVRLAGLSGAMAVMFGAYGAHGFKDRDPALKTVYDSGYHMHLVHSIALLGVPLTRRPNLVGGLMCLGIVMFSGSCYYHALSGNTSVRRVTPYGGLMIIAAWLAMML